MKKSFFKRVAVCCLALVMILTSMLSVGAVTKPGLVTDDEERSYYLDIFNNGVNAVKSDMPYLVYKKQATIGKELKGSASDWLAIIFNSIFLAEESLASGLITKLVEDENNSTSTKEIYKGFSRDNILPVSGENYISALSAADKFDMQVQELTDKNGENEQLEVYITFDDGFTPENVSESGMDRVFDLASGSINPTIFGSSDGEDGILSTVKFSNFTYDNASVYAVFDANGLLKSYKTSVTYNFDISFYDFSQMMTLLSPSGTNYFELGVEFANKIIAVSGGTPVDAKELLKNQNVNVQYVIDTEMSKFDWSPRFFGDIDNDGDVDAYDARSALRHAVGLQVIDNNQGLLYGDINFDGVINSADARLILRTAVKLESKFNYPPDGKEVSIVDTEDKKDEVPAEAENTSGNEEASDGNDTGNATQAPESDSSTVNPSDIVDSLGEIIDSIAGGIVSTEEGIEDIVKDYQYSLGN
ncbi:MAG: dockerin type I repeat-containing protein [Clostridia bacterium]|nr:dockerin type I repeat-containing protein [Clostridia bacterium]